MNPQEPTNQSQGTAPIGVVLMAFGKPQYYWAAYNLAHSIKRFNKAVQIALISESLSKDSRYYCPELTDVIDVYVDLPSSNIYSDKKLNPAKAKLLVYDLLPFQENLLLDVDAVCLKDIEPLLKHLSSSDKDYQTIVVGNHKIKQGRNFKEMLWAYADTTWEHYNLPSDATLIATNSSAQFIRKGDKAQALYSKASDLLINNPIPLHKLRTKWGGGQPDELYINVALCLLDMDAQLDTDIVYVTSKRELDFSTIQSNYYLMGYYGGQGYTPRYYIDWLDRLIKSWYQVEGKTHKYYIHRIIEHKYVNR